MSEPTSIPKLPRNAENTRQAILNSAEAVFAEHGYDGARIDVIAQAAGYNQGLIFRYFGDKLGLYAAVLKRIDSQTIDLQAQMIAPLLEDETILTDARRFKAYLITGLGAFFDFMVEHPRIMQMLVWEQAERWQTYAEVASLFEVEGFERFEALFSKAQKAGLLRADSDPFPLFLLAEQICWTFPTSLPFYQMILPGRDFSSTETQKRLRDQVIEFIVSGLMAETNESEAGGTGENLSPR